MYEHAVCAHALSTYHVFCFQLEDSGEENFFADSSVILVPVT